MTRADVQRLYDDAVSTGEHLRRQLAECIFRGQLAKAELIRLDAQFEFNARRQANRLGYHIRYREWKDGTKKIELRKKKGVRVGLFDTFAELGAFLETVK